MSTCGYVCPKCEGKGFLEDGNACDWCGVKLKSGNDEVRSESNKSGKEEDEVKPDIEK